MSIGSFTLIKNEAPWIAAHILRVLPWIGEMVFYDGGSEDGTLEIIERIQRDCDPGHKIKLFKDRDPRDLEGDYVRMFNECLHSLSTDLAVFLHPDMLILNPERLPEIAKSKAVAMLTHMRSFAGEPDGQLYEIKGRGEAWKNVYRLRNPDLGAHYFGHYGAHAEDVYFSAITGDEHKNHAPFWDRYPYEIEDSGLEILHFSDVRPAHRRYDRMVKCLLNQGHPLARAELIAMSHPRVTLKDSADFSFIPSAYPADFLAAQKKYAPWAKEPNLV